MPIAGGERGVGCREDADATIRDDFGNVIEVRENAPDLPRRALSRMPVGFVGASDYQSAVRKFGPSDAAHLAFAEAAEADFVTCDDRLLRQCRRVQPSVWFGTLMAFCDKENLQ